MASLPIYRHNLLGGLLRLLMYLMMARWKSLVAAVRLLQTSMPLVAALVASPAVAARGVVGGRR